MERAMGSIKFCCVIFILHWTTNILFVVWSYTLAYNPLAPDPMAMLKPSIGFWGVVLSMTVLECKDFPGS